MGDLAKFLLARISEDEAAARAVKPLGHNFDMGGNRRDDRFTHGRLGFASEDGYPRRLPEGGEGAHFARWEPARVLAECEAKRRIVKEAHAVAVATHGVVDIPTWSTGLAGDLADHVLVQLASAYADHPDYRPEWRP